MYSLRSTVARSLRLSLLVGLFPTLEVIAFQKPLTYPNWWVNEGAVSTSETTRPDDFAVANMGQLKNFYMCSLSAIFNSIFPEMSYDSQRNIEKMIVDLSASASSESNYSAVNLGQAKALAENVFKLLEDFYGPIGFRPWDSSLPSDDYAAINIGQLKNIFSFDIVAGQLHLGNQAAFSSSTGLSFPDRIISDVSIPIHDASGANVTLLRDDEVNDSVHSITKIKDLIWPFTQHTPTEGMQRISSASSTITPDPLDPSRWLAFTAGEVTLELKSNTKTAMTRLSVSGPYVETKYGVKEYVQNSLIWHIHNSVAALVAGKTPGIGAQAILNSDGSRNANLWVSPIDISSIVVGHSYENWIEGVLVTPLHVIVVTHVGTQIGASFTFRSADNQRSITRTVVKTQDCGPVADILLVTLNEPITSEKDGVTFARVLPANVGSHWLKGSYGWRDQLPLLKCKRNGGHSLGLSMGGTGARASEPRPSWMSGWSCEWTGGDSGSAVGTVINGTYVFLGCARGGPTLYDDDTASTMLLNRTDVEFALKGSGYALTDIDLSEFPVY